MDRSSETEEMRIGSQRMNIYILNNIRQIEVSRGVEPFVEEGVKKNKVDRYNCREGVEKQSKDIRREARSIHQLSRSYRGSRNFFIRPTSCQGSVKIAIGKDLKSSTDSQVLRRYRGGVEIA